MTETVDRIAELEADLDATKAERDALLDERNRARRRRFKLGLWSLRLWAGPELGTTARAWFDRLRNLERPSDLASGESADLVAAILGRLLRIGAFGLIVAAFAILTPVVALWQTVLIREQNAAIREQIDQQAAQNARQNTSIRKQNATIQQQVDQQTADTLIVRRAQLLTTIYEEDCQEERCGPSFHLRARQEAVSAFVGIERGRGVEPDLRSASLKDAYLVYASLNDVDLSLADLSHANLTDANLNSASLMYADLSGAILKNVNLRHASLFKANLIDARLSGADLATANLSYADLKGADLSNANLFGVDFSDANLDNAYFLGANLRFANLSEAKNLTRRQIGDAKGNAKTLLPDGLTRPYYWDD